MNRLLSAPTIALGLAVLGPASASEMIELNGRAMGTTWSVKYRVESPEVAASVVRDRVAARLEELERIFSTFRPDSEISRFNATQGTDWFAVAPDFARAAVAARWISEVTRGAFDVTAEPLIRLWGFGPTGPPADPVAARDVVQTRRSVDWRQLEAREAAPAIRRMRAGVTVDFSSLAKGLAVDAVAGLLGDLGLKHRLVRIGGDLKAVGERRAGEPWQAGIQDPVRPHRVATHVLLTDATLSTSGNYHNYVETAARRVGHVIDPRTGHPADTALASVSVVHASCAISSAFATGLFVLGPEDGYRVAVDAGLAGLFLTRDETGALVHRATPAFAHYAAPLEATR